MKRTPAQDAVWRDYQEVPGRFEPAFAKAKPPAESWWANPGKEGFYVRAAKELPRMLTSEFGKSPKIILATGYAYERRKPEVDGETTSEL